MQPNAQKILLVVVGLLIILGAVFTILNKKPTNSLYIEAPQPSSFSTNPDLLSGTLPSLYNLFTNPNSFFTKDKNNVYFRNRIIPSADPETFKGLGSVYLDKQNIFVYSCYDEQVTDSSCINILKGADVATFFIVLDGYYAKDKNHVYYLRYPPSQIYEADPDTFVVLETDLKNDHPFAKDSSNVFYYNYIIKGADPSTFRILNREYATDKFNVYSSGMGRFVVVPNADIVTFIPLGASYGKDKSSVFYGIKKISEADLATFEVMNNMNYMNEARDKNNFYQFGRIATPPAQ